VIPTADRGRTEVYAAELAAYEGTDLETIVPLADLVAAAHRLTSAPWWPPGRDVAVRPARRDARSSTTRWRSSIVIHVAAEQATRATLVHELAHALAGASAGHGPVFRRAHVDLASAAFGGDRGAWLAAAYRVAGLTLGARTWDPPAEGSRSVIAL
jgi:hypothetical protein